MSTNPLLNIGDLQDYAAIRPEHVAPAITQLLSQARAAVERAADPTLPATWDALVSPLDEASEPLWRAWSAVGHLNSVVNTPELRAAYNAALPLITEFSTWVGLHEGLYRQYLRLAEPEASAALSPTRQRIVALALRDFRLSGVELPPAERARYAEIADQEAQASQKFSENVLDATDSYALWIGDVAELAGLPDDALAAARQAAQEDGREGYKITLKAPSYLPVMQYAERRSLRETLYRAYGTRASDTGDARYDNSASIEELLRLRAEESALLGYAHFAERQLQTRMAGEPQRVLTFLRDLARRAKPYAERDLQELRAFAKERLGLDTLEPWDVGYAAERLRTERYDYSEDALKQYFPQARVVDGFFDITQRLFDIQLHEIEAPVWHADVRVFRVDDAQGQVLGHVYFDLYARTGKQGGAWVDVDRNRRRTASALHTPVVFLTCNFAPPTGDRPSLLTHDDVITLFHEAGHALHALLSDVDESGASPFSSVEWDAIELPSQFMENFCWEWNVLERLSAHVDHGGPLPRELYQRLVAARNFQSGLQTVRQIEFSLFDMLLHAGQANGSGIGNVLGLLQQVRDEVAVLHPPAWHRLPHSFSHIFAGGYGAGYYSYKWAEVLSADAYAAFEEAAGDADADGARDTLLPEVGARLRREIFAVGGSRPAMDSFVAFRGREPSLDALLRHSGMTETA